LSEAEEQRCWNHKLLNVLEQLPRRHQGVAKAQLRAIAYAPSRAEAEGRRRELEAWCREHGYGKAAETLGGD
jgi:transposase-like protein